MIIDTWNSDTYSEDIKFFLQEHADTICRYHQQELDTDAYLKALARWEMPPPNPHADAYNAVRERLHELMSTKTIRAFHYTRLVDSEVENILANGFTAPTTKTSFQRLSERLNHVVEEGHLTRAEADQIIASSPLNDPAQLNARRGFWMTTGAFHPTDGAVELLVSHWGGEVGYFWIDGNKAPDLLRRVQSVGRGRIIEIAVPLSDTNGEPIFGCFNAAQQIVDVFSVKNGFQILNTGFDLYIKSDVPGAAILAVHTEGEEIYDSFGRGTPQGDLAGKNY